MFSKTLLGEGLLLSRNAKTGQQPGNLLRALHTSNVGSQHQFLSRVQNRSSQLQYKPNRLRQIFPKPRTQHSVRSWGNKTAATNSSSTNPWSQHSAEELFSLALTSPTEETHLWSKLSFVEFDANGVVTRMNAEENKEAILEKYQLIPRDVRNIIQPDTIPYIHVRPSTIIVNMQPFKLLIQANQVLLIDTLDSEESYIYGVFVYYLEGKLQAKHTSTSKPDTPYEMRALEAVLITVIAALKAEANSVHGSVTETLYQIEQSDSIDDPEIRHLLKQSQRLSTFEKKASLVRDAIGAVLEVDEDMAAMYLTDRKNGKPHTEQDHQEVEILLESYQKSCSELVARMGSLVSSVNKTEDAVRAVLDAKRNQIMLLDLRLTIIMLGVASGTFIAGLYGMNLVNYMEDAKFGFLTMTSVSMTVIYLVILSATRKLRMIQRVRIRGGKHR